MRFLTLILLFLSYNTFAQKNDIFHIDSLPTEGVLLDKGWKFHAGDNPDWAKPDFDDSAWESIDPTKDIMDLPQIQDGKIGWIRLKMKIDTNLLSQPFGLRVLQTIASEIYINGHIIKKYGNINTENSRATSVHSIINFSQNNTEISIAVRFALQKLPIYNKYASLDNNFFNAKLLPLNTINFSAWTRDWVEYSSVAFISGGIFLILFILHLAFYIYYPPQKANLYFSAMAFCYTLHSFLWALYVVSPVIENMEGLMVIGILRVLIFPFIYIFLLKALYSIFNLKLDYIYWFAFIINISMLFACFFNYKSGVLVLETTIIQLNTLISIYITIKAFFAHIKNTKIVLLGMICSVICFGIRALDVWYIIPHSLLTDVFMPFIATISIPISISWFLGAEFAITNKKLVEKLKEVKQLATEKQQILATQNETLEKQVEERTAELKATQNQLIQKEKLASMGELTAGIAHEIQNPLNFVNNFSELSVDLVKDLKEEIEKPAQDKEYIGELFDDLSQNQEKINHHGKRASGIVKGMLEHSRASTGVKELTDINKLADEYLRLSYHGMRAKDKDFNANFELKADPNLPKIQVISQDIGRVLMNLINNAFYAVNQRKQLSESSQLSESYTPSVSVTTQHLDNQIIICVKDNGTGMPESVRAKVFQPFFTTKPTGQGTGLGLSLAYDIVTKGHGGALEVVSTEGVGSEFIILLPIKING